MEKVFIAGAIAVGAILLLGFVTAPTPDSNEAFIQRGSGSRRFDLIRPSAV